MLNWDDLQFFLAVARHGTLSAAARSLKVTQPTVGRRISAFEERIGAPLFARSASGFSLSETGRAVLLHAEQIEKHALSTEALALARRAGVEGEVRITASEWMIRSVLGPALAPLLARHPGLCIELLADARHLSLIRREADLAVRPSRFKHQDIVQRELADLEFGLYASESYLAQHGMPDFASGCAGQVFIAMTYGLSTLADYEWLPSLSANARIAVRTNGREPMATMAVAGVGIACLPRALGDASIGLRRLATPVPSPQRKLWLGMHRAARSSSRVRETARFLTQAFVTLRWTLAPSGSS